MKPTKTHFVSEEYATTVPEEQVDEELYKCVHLETNHQNLSLLNVY